MHTLSIDLRPLKYESHLSLCVIGPVVLLLYFLLLFFFVFAFLVVVFFIFDRGEEGSRMLRMIADFEV